MTTIPGATTQTGGGSLLQNYSTFSGAHIVAVFNNTVEVTLEGIAWQVRREITPIYTLGDANPRAFVKGKRAIAGTMTFGVFDRDTLLETILGSSGVNVDFDTGGSPNADDYAQVDWGQGRVTDTGGIPSGLVQDQQIYLPGSAALYGAPGEGATVQWFSASSKDDPKIAAQAASFWRARNIWYCDELPPFNVTITMINEEGQAAQCRLHHIYLINEAMGFNMDTVGTEKTMNFLARTRTPLHPIRVGATSNATAWGG